MDGSVGENERDLVEQQKMAQGLVLKLVSLEQKLTEVRVEADRVQIQANGLVARHIEELKIDVNGKSNVDRSVLDSLKISRDTKDGERYTKSEAMGNNCKDIRSSADYMQGKISEYEVLLLAYAEQKAYLVSEIERMKAELVTETVEEGFQNMQNDYKSTQLDILNE